jgi:aspartyl-tRNA(Asn)/glutamyl-tRNA(Gln) amidotransferase subunit A
MSSLHDLTLCQAQEALKKKTISALELVDAYLHRAQACSSLNAYITLCPDKARQQAKEADIRLQAGQARALEGIPLGIKDNFCTKGVLSTGGSKILYNFVPPYESHVTQKLLDQGSVFLGKCNMDEFACGGSNTHSAYGAVINPWPSQEPRVPGGSSGGPAAAVASGQALASLGSDTGGSVRQPAAHCGLVGLRPTYGRCSRFGVMSMACSLDQPGPMGRTVQDVAQLLQVIAGYDPKDAQSVNIAVPDYSQALGQSVQGMKIGIPKEFPLEDLEPRVAELWLEKQQVLQEAGCIIQQVSLPRIKDGLTCYYILVPAEVASNMARYDGIRYGLRQEKDTLEELYQHSRGAGFGSEIKRRILMGNYVLSQGYASGYYQKAQKIRACIRAEFRHAFGEVDALLFPTAPHTADRLYPDGLYADGLAKEELDPLKEYYADIFTVPGSLAGVPGLSVPGGLGLDNMPLGIQLVGRHFEEARLLQLGYVLEQSTKMPPLPLYRTFDSCSLDHLVQHQRSS